MAQAFKTTEIIPAAYVLVLSKSIADEGDLHRKVALNPYTPKAQHIISERFPQTNIFDSIKAVIFTEPEGSYERDFRQLGVLQQAEEICRQIDVSTNLQQRLLRYWDTYGAELVLLSCEHIYDCLSLVVFETTNIQQIEQRYAQKQRRYFRFFIISLIEDAKKDTVRLHKKPASGRRLGSATFAAIYLILVLSLTYGFYEQYTIHSLKSGILGVETQIESKNLPIRLKIPSINVNAMVENVGVTSDGAMEVPKNTNNVGWFDLGVRPGERGSAVIAGHFDGEYNTTGVFTHLNMLKVGDTLSVENDKGASIAFIVKEIRTYNPGYAEDVFSRSDGTYLNLITCNGVWDRTKKTYSKRLVIFAELSGK